MYSFPGNGPYSSPEVDFSFSTVLSPAGIVDSYLTTDVTSTYPDGSTSEVNQTFSSDGSLQYESIQKFAPDGRRTEIGYAFADGRSGTQLYNADGSRSSSVVYADHTSTTYVNDGHGNEVENHFDANSHKTSDSWSQADGSYGSDIFYADGSVDSRKHYGDGSSSMYYDDGQGGISTTYFDKYARQVGQSLSASDGFFSQQTNVYNDDGSYEVKSTTTYSSGVIETSDTVGAADGSSDYTWTSSDGSYRHETYSLLSNFFNPLSNHHHSVYYNASTGETNASESYDDINQGGWHLEFSSNTYSDSTQYMSSSWTNSDGSYRNSWMARNGNYGEDDHDASTGTSTGESHNVIEHSVFTYDNVDNADGSYKHKWLTTFSDGSISTEEEDGEVDGTYTKSWSLKDGSYGNEAYAAFNHEKKGEKYIASDGHTISFYDIVNGDSSSEQKTVDKYNDSDATVISNDFIKHADGSTEEIRITSSILAGTSNEDHFVFANGSEVRKLVVVNPDGSTRTYDDFLSADGSREHDSVWTFIDGAHSSDHYTYDADGSYVGTIDVYRPAPFPTTHEHIAYTASTTEVVGYGDDDNGYSRTWDIWLNGSHPDIYTYTFPDGSTRTYDHMYGYM